ncbi:uncharacterized protein LOC142234236 [Haematobia irritans]|uniref:uncharacterized protein LOC142234236 n=1 Tax=Haematobia irritans TaxID=7368 RepID=UPI003F4FF969
MKMPRYLYGAADEKFVPLQSTKSKADNQNLVATYKFNLENILKGPPSFNKNDVPIDFKISPDSLLNLCIKIVDALPLPSIYAWNIEDICKWLRRYGYHQYQNTFRQNCINGHSLLLLDASALCSMNIKNFDHIKDIAYGIRMLFHFEMTKFGRSITCYPEFSNELYKLFRIKTGAKYEQVRRSDLWRNMQLIRKQDPCQTHWEILEKWLGFDKNPEYPDRFGGIKRNKLYHCQEKVESLPHHSPSTQCHCLPPCESTWKNTDCRPPWLFKCLPHLKPSKEFVQVCNGCLSPCTCHWTSKMYMTHGILSCLKTAFPHKYGPPLKYTGTTYEQTERFEKLNEYRLSLF